MADEGLASHRRDPIKSSVGNVAAQRRRQHATTVGKERRESLVRAKRLCRVGISGDSDVSFDNDMMIEEEQSILETHTSSAVEDLKSAVAYQGKGAMQKKVTALRELRRLLSRSEFPPVEAALKAGAVPILVQCLSFGSPDEQLLEAAWCLTNIAAGKPEETEALLPALPLLIAHLGGAHELVCRFPSVSRFKMALNNEQHHVVDIDLKEVQKKGFFLSFDVTESLTIKKSSLSVAEQCAWALGNVAGEGEKLKNVLLSQGALLPLARMMLPNKGSTVRTAAWALSNLIKGPDSKAATELIRIDGVLDAIVRHLKKAEDELATEVAWVVVYLSALSNVATCMLVKNDVLQLLVERLATSGEDELATEVAWVVVYLCTFKCRYLYVMLMLQLNDVETLAYHFCKLYRNVKVLRSLGNLVAGDSSTTYAVLVPGREIAASVIEVLVKCLKSEHRVLKKEAAWVLSNIAAGSVEHKHLIYSSEAVPLLLRLLSTAPFDIRKEVAYVLGNLCVAPTEGDGKPNLIVEHLVSLIGKGCLPGFIDLVRSADTEAARLGLQFMELVLRGMPHGEGPKLVEREEGIDAMERFQFHENEDLRNMANGLVDKYFGEDYGLDE
ncbi:Importin subunit alpha-2 [Morella rubra]|uniref:Importin subunit alpha-2 n=1 Tax=Morella rubra TaxID=262757 RepID=A0A6A1WF94_9ROSI|nr:Importin subunit alpha-2 [Morella rubra]